MLVVCWTFLAVRDSQIDKGVMWADLGVSEGLCAAVLCCLSGIQSEAIMSRPISAGWTRFKNLLRAVVLCLPPILGGILLTRGGNAWAEVAAMVVLIALTTRIIKNEVLQLRASTPSVATFDDEYPQPGCESTDGEDSAEMSDKATTADGARDDYDEQAPIILPEGQPPKQDHNAIRMHVLLFGMFDKDDDGVLNKQEYREYLRGIGMWGGYDSVSGERNYRYHLDEWFDKDYCVNDVFSGGSTGHKAGWQADCAEMACDAKKGISLAVFASKVYGEYRQGKLVDDLANVWGISPDQASWKLANLQASRNRANADASAKDKSWRRRQQRCVVGLHEYINDLWNCIDVSSLDLSSSYGAGDN